MFNFNWEDLEKKSTKEVLEGLMNGKYPLQDTKTKGYYYMQPQKNSNGVINDEKMERIDVPSADSPNPTWQSKSNHNNSNLYKDEKWNVWCDKNNGFEEKQYDKNKYGDGITQNLVDKMMTDEVFQDAMNNYTIPSEGCYGNEINDKGGETKYGISKRWYPNEDIPNLTRERANALLYRDYWNYNGINKLPRTIAGAVFDNAVNQGQPTAIKNTHKALGLDSGNIIGKQTMSKISNIPPSQFLINLKNAAMAVNNSHISNDKDQNNFKNGWNNRINRWRVFP
ncbi:MAG: hypothetical protein E7012_06135 [Alphaproteobacteria bacterium]|nr:hypothetical protein [Alphaproteobacteria bacterium]